MDYNYLKKMSEKIPKNDNFLDKVFELLGIKFEHMGELIKYLFGEDFKMPTKEKEVEEIIDKVIKIRVKKRESRITLKEPKSRIILKEPSHEPLKLPSSSRPIITIRPVKDGLTLADEVIDFNIYSAWNEQAKETFISYIRGNLKSLLGSTKENYVNTDGSSNKNYFHCNDMQRFADRYGLPFLAIPQSSHWFLALEIPKYDASKSKWTVQVYNPMKDNTQTLETEWVGGPNFDWQYYLNLTLPCSAAAMSLIKQNAYHLNLPARTPNLIKTKLTRKQFDWFNCGPICLFEAALLAALSNNLRPEYQGFISKGIRLFEDDSHITILTAGGIREEENS